MKKVSLHGFAIDGNPKKPICGVFKAKILDYKIAPYSFKNGARGYQTIFSVAFMTSDSESETRDIVLQHPFLSASEQPYILNSRGARWRALHISLRLNQEETEKFCTFLDGTQDNTFYTYYEKEVDTKCCKCDTLASFTVVIEGKHYPVCSQHAPQPDIFRYHYNNRFLLGKDVYVDIKDPDKERKYAQNRFLTEVGYNHLLESQNEKQEDVREQPKAKEIDVGNTELPDDDFGV